MTARRQATTKQDRRGNRSSTIRRFPSTLNATPSFPTSPGASDHGIRHRVQMTVAASPRRLRRACCCLHRAITNVVLDADAVNEIIMTAEYGRSCEPLYPTARSTPCARNVLNPLIVVTATQMLAGGMSHTIFIATSLITDELGREPHPFQNGRLAQEPNRAQASSAPGKGAVRGNPILLNAHVTADQYLPVKSMAWAAMDTSLCRKSRQGLAVDFDAEPRPGRHRDDAARMLERRSEDRLPDRVLGAIELQHRRGGRR